MRVALRALCSRGAVRSRARVAPLASPWLHNVYVLDDPALASALPFSSLFPVYDVTSLSIFLLYNDDRGGSPELISGVTTPKCLEWTKPRKSLVKPRAFCLRNSSLKLTHFLRVL